MLEFITENIAQIQQLFANACKGNHEALNYDQCEIFCSHALLLLPCKFFFGAFIGSLDWLNGILLSNLK